jgi:hypothetical protein
LSFLSLNDQSGTSPPPVPRGSRVIVNYRKGFVAFRRLLAMDRFFQFLWRIRQEMSNQTAREHDEMLR